MVDLIQSRVLESWAGVTEPWRGPTQEMDGRPFTARASAFGARFSSPLPAFSHHCLPAHCAISILCEK